MKYRVIGFFSLLLIPIYGHAGSCPNSGNNPDPLGAVCGAVYKYAATGLQNVQSGYRVSFCRVDAPFVCKTGGTVWAPDGYGTYSWTSFIANGVTSDYSGSPYYTWNAYAWSDAEMYGSSDLPIARVSFPNGGAYGIGLYVPPRPLSPDPVYPNDGARGVPSNFPVKWKDGLDAARRSSSWPTTYAIYYKLWPFGGTEPATYTLSVANQPCNAVTPGVCETYVTGEPDGNFRWYVVAKMDVSASTNIPGSIFTTQSAPAYFTVGYAPTPVYQGCYTDDGNRALPNELMTSGATVESCTQAGFNAGYRYAGLQWYGECWVGNTIGYAQDSETQCNTPCNANSSQTCGGAWHNSIWNTGR
jgi:hypothetical protein